MLESYPSGLLLASIGIEERDAIKETDHCCRGFDRMNEWLDARGLQSEERVGNAPAKLANARERRRSDASARAGWSFDERVEGCDPVRLLGYAVHIRRTSGRIELVEWTAFASAAPDLEERGAVDSAGQQVPVYAWKDATLVWSDGEIVVDRMSDEWRSKLGDIANRLSAHAIGDDGERYFADGRVDYGEGPESIQGIRTMAAFRYVPPTRTSNGKWSRIVVALAGVLVVVAAGVFLALRK